MDHVGIDVHKRESQVCILTPNGEITEVRIATTRERFREALGGRPRAKVLIETSTESEWVARCLEELGHELIVADPGFAPMYGMRTRRVKTDLRDARALAEACRSGTFRLAHRRSEQQRRVTTKLVVREALVRSRTSFISVVRALLRKGAASVAAGRRGRMSRGPRGLRNEPPSHPVAGPAAGVAGAETGLAPAEWTPWR
jgi:transposase